MSWLSQRLSPLLIGISLAGTLLQGQSSPVMYVYDEIGRLVGVINPAGDAATYTYDAVGNLLSIARHTAGTVSIMDFAPNSGPVGMTVTIHGIGFSATPSSNTVTFNGVAATVVTATTIKLTVTVPTGATTGTIAVTSPSGSATSATSFTVAASSAPTITSFTPSIATIGTTLTISGTNFDAAILANNRSQVNQTLTAALSGTTTTSLLAKVPVATASGPLKLTTMFGTVVSAADLFIPPGSYTAADVQYTNRMNYGDTRSVSITTSGKIGLVVFDAPVGKRTSIKSVPGPNNTVSVYGPYGNVLASRSGIFTVLVEPGYLPTAGTYTIGVDPVSTGTGTVQITLYHVPADVTGTFAISSTGDAKNAAITTPGQNARFTFSGTAGHRMALNATPPNGTVSIRSPTEVSLVSQSIGIFGTFVEPVTLTATGTHAVVADPLEANTGTHTLTLYDVPNDSTGTMTINGGSVPASFTPGQNASRTFSGTIGQLVTVRITSNTVPGSTTVKLLKPDGSELTSTSSIFSSFNLSQQTLPVTGTYTVFMNPSGANSGSMNVAATEP